MPVVLWTHGMTSECVGTKQIIYPQKRPLRTYFKGYLLPWIYLIIIIKAESKRSQDIRKLPTERTLYPGNKNQNIDLLVAVNISEQGNARLEYTVIRSRSSIRSHSGVTATRSEEMTSLNREHLTDMFSIHWMFST
jgi:hypothetical protein